MQLTAKTVDWNKLEGLRFDRATDDVIFSAYEDLQIGRPPWPSDSTIQVAEVSEIYDTVKSTLANLTRTHADKIMSTLIHRSFLLPWELKSCERGMHFIGAISPSTVREYLNVFSQISYAELDEMFDSHMPAETRESCQIAEYPSEEVFTGYLRQWEDLFKYAADRDAGVLLHCG